jgi:hypothetical protein
MAHRSTIVFANSRGLVERMAAALNELAGEEIARAHHGSVSRSQRVEIEDALKSGTLRCVVATSSLELGIDMAAVDMVVLVESPTTVSRGLQRVGRAGHQVGAASKARVFPKHRGDLLETALVVDRMRHGLIERTVIPANPLDVLAQQVVAAVATGERTADDLFAMVRRAMPYRDLSRPAYDAVLDMLSGRYPSDDFAELRPRITWDRIDGTLSPRGNAGGSGLAGRSTAACTSGAEGAAARRNDVQAPGGVFVQFFGLEGDAITNSRVESSRPEAVGRVLTRTPREAVETGLALGAFIELGALEEGPASHSCRPVPASAGRRHLVRFSPGSARDGAPLRPHHQLSDSA